MKKNLASIELNCIVKELQSLIDGKIDKIYLKGKEELWLQIHVPNFGKRLLRVIIGKFMFFSENKPNFDDPSGFCMYLRKKLGNSRIREITQKGFERIVEFVFDTKEGNVALIIEFFGGGNVLLVRKGIILSGLIYKEWKDRSIKPNEKYVYPKKEFNFLKLDEKQFQEFLEKSDKESIVKALAMDLGLGGVYAEETCLVANIDKNKKPSQVDSGAVFKALDELREKKIEAYIVEDNDVVPFQLELYKGKEQKKCESFNSALDSVFWKDSMIEKSEETKKKDKQLDKIKRIIKSQEETINKLGKKEKDYRGKGELIYNNYKVIEEVLTEINKASERFGFDEIKKKLKGHKLVKEVNSKEKSVLVELK